MNYKLFRERATGAAADLFIASLSNVEIVPASWKQGPGNARIPVAGLLTARSDEDLTSELTADQAYFLAGPDGERFDFELPGTGTGTGKAIAKSGNTFKIAIV